MLKNLLIKLGIIEDPKKAIANLIEELSKEESVKVIPAKKKPAKKAAKKAPVKKKAAKKAK